MADEQGQRIDGSDAHLGWHSRGYLPHFDGPGIVQSVTFRLADALPAHVVERITADPAQARSEAWPTRLEAYLDAGHGACHLRRPRIARMVQEALFYFDGRRYRLFAWVVMPNHVHVLLEVFAGYPLGDVIHSWKSFTASEANDLLGREGRFWFPDYFDRYIRNREHFSNARTYIHYNPVKAELVTYPEEWPFSSARWVQ